MIYRALINILPAVFLLLFPICESQQCAGQTTFNVFAGQSIQSAINGAATGDTILVNPGVFTENLDFGNRELSLRSVQGPGTTSIAVNGGTGVELSGNSELIGFTISGASASIGAGVEVSGTGTLIQGNIFENNTQNAGGFGAAIGGNNVSPIINQNIFRNNSSDSQFTSGVVAFVNDSNPLITNNIFYDNDSSAISLVAGTNPRVINNTFFDNDTAIRFNSGFSTREVRNNIIVNNVIGLDDFFNMAGLNNPRVSNNLLFNNGVDFQNNLNLLGINGNISADPFFVDALNADFHLLAQSPAIDAGSGFNPPLLDFDNNLRPFDGDGINGAQFDIGAFEFSSVPEPSSTLIALGILGVAFRRTRSV